MTLKNALNQFNRMVSETSKKSETKVYQDFIHLLTGLEEKNLTETEIQSIETELDALELNISPANKKKYFRKALRKFEKFLKDTFSLVTKGYYTKLGLAYGSAMGVAFAPLLGMVFLSGLDRSLDISMGVAIGSLVGLLIGSKLDSQAAASGKVV